MKIATSEQPHPLEVEKLVRENPLALLVSATEEDSLATPLPMLLENREEYQLLVGHFGRGNPHIELLRSQPRALAIFKGRDAYLSPSWLEDRTQAPSWNYQVAEFLVSVRFVEEEERRREILERQVRSFEEGRPRAWATDEMGPRFEELFRGILPFEAQVLRTRAKFKLGQKERSDVFEQWLQGLTDCGQGAMAQIMRANRPNS